MNIHNQSVSQPASQPTINTHGRGHHMRIALIVCVYIALQPKFQQDNISFLIHERKCAQKKNN